MQTLPYFIIFYTTLQSELYLIIALTLDSKCVKADTSKRIQTGEAVTYLQTLTSSLHSQLSLVRIPLRVSALRSSTSRVNNVMKYFFFNALWCQKLWKGVEQTVLKYPADNA